ncbi:MAG: glycoside hydrolase family 127 protein [Victivallaceae bacterium]|nr:glycoside hydrolase family 127 protein [Victivallaceae bacterium]
MYKHVSNNSELQPIKFGKVNFTDGFWQTRIDRASDVSLSTLWELLADEDEGHVLQNLQIAAGLAEGEFAGVSWADAWMAKWLEAAAVVSSQTDDKELDKKIDEMIELLAKVQAPDGYLASQTVARGEGRFVDTHYHELYTMGHMLTAGVTHYRLTGKDNFLTIAKKIGDFVTELYSGEVTRHMTYFPFNPSIIMGLVELYRATEDKKYLDAAQGFVDRRGSAPRQWGDDVLHEWMGGDLCQDRVPLRKENEMVGHSVLSTYLYCGAADVVAETGEKKLFDALKRIWHNYTERKMFLNGGACAASFGVTNRKLGGHVIDVVHEAAGDDYYLPNALSYNETCAQIGAFMWASRMNNIEPDASYGDVMEQILYSGVLAGVDLTGNNWFYRNILRWHGGAAGPYDEDHKRYTCIRFKPGREAICCPTNILRTEVEFGNYLYSTKDNELWVHHYAANSLETILQDGTEVKLSQATDYPWNGSIKITIETSARFTLQLRIPAWVKNASVVINNEKMAIAGIPGSYLELTRRWQAGDCINLLLPMAPRMIIGNPLVEETRGQVAFMRGPVVYCLEAHELPNNVPLHEICIPRDIKITGHYEPELLGSVIVLEGRAMRMKQGDWKHQLYKELSAETLTPIDIRLIPYYTWANRGIAAMSVWLPLG